MPSFYFDADYFDPLFFDCGPDTIQLELQQGGIPSYQYYKGRAYTLQEVARLREEDRISEKVASIIVESELIVNELAVEKEVELNEEKLSKNMAVAAT